MSKRIVVCCDGTWNTPDVKTATNVVKMSRAILPTASDGTTQSVFYDWGVGTGSGLDRWLGGAFGHGLLRNVEDGYRFIVDNYEPGDQLFLVGFSRGAYTVRSIVGFIRNCGLLHKAHADLITDAVRLYKSRGFHPDSTEAQEFRNKYSRETDVHFIGVWDTVGSLGIPLRGLNILTRSKYQFHDVELSGIVKNAYQALGIDEARSPFRPSIWAPMDKEGQHIEQVWFTGVHSDVGGGYAEMSLSDVALKWMLDKAVECGLEMDESYVSQVVRPDPMGTLHNSRTGFYRLMFPYHREIDNGKGANESVSEAAMQRFNAGGYNAKNLADYVRRQGEQADARVGE